MAGTSGNLSTSATPTQKLLHTAQSATHLARPPYERDGSQQSINGHGAPRPLPSSNVSFATRGSSLATTPAPGSFTSTMRTVLPASRAGSALDIGASSANFAEDNERISEQTLLALKESLNKELKIKEGTENMLEALQTKKAKQTKEQRQKVEAELNSSNAKIKDLKNQIQDLQRPRGPTTPTRTRMEGLFTSNGLRSPRSASKSMIESDPEETSESPTYALAEILQALEVEGLTPDYYVGHANHLVELFKRHPTLKHDLVWSVFGLRMQVMLLSESREVVAAGYRMIRYAISDVHSLQRIRALHTDYLVILSLTKQSKADVEREQALKFIRAFLDIKDGVEEIPRAIVRTIASVAEYGQSDDRHEDRLKSICIETLAEIMVRHPALVVASGGLRPLSLALSEGVYKGSESLTGAFLYLLDSPERRRYLRSGYELEVLFSHFTDSLDVRAAHLKQNAKAITHALRNWSGLMTLSMFNFRAIRSLIASMSLPNPLVRETVMDLLYNLLRIKSPFWATSFLAGRRLTTYGRVAGLKTTSSKSTMQVSIEEDTADRSFLDHYTTLLTAVLIEAGMVQTLLQITKDNEQPALKRKTTLLLGEILKLASKLLPSTWSDHLQLLPDLFAAAAKFGNDERFVATGTVYQISSVSRTLYQTAPTTSTTSDQTRSGVADIVNGVDDLPKSNTTTAFDEATFRQWQVETQVLSSTNPAKWKWDVILKIIEGPLTNGKRLDEAIKASKFVKRIMSFYRPFKYKFAEIRLTRVTQMYVKVGCALMTTFLQTSEGVRYLADNKLMRQIAECLAQCDPTSGLTAAKPMFSKEKLSDTLCSGYFAMLGVLSASPKGLQVLDRWRMINMMYHIVDLRQRPDLIKLILSNFNYQFQGHPRVMLSKALTAGSKETRIYATNILRKQSVRRQSSNNEGLGDSKWAIQMLVTQLYDPDVEVCATAVKILEEACNRKTYLEYIVKCRPALDHLGEIGAPLLLRFLSTSIGYHYLDGLDYISNEMDDWFLGRNDTYVGVIEASLARTFADLPEESTGRMSMDEDGFEDIETEPHVPPHFYRELARTKEGCKLLREKGHFEEFANTIRMNGMEAEDQEVILKVKGCLWAVANVGCMENGGRFLEETVVVEHIVNIAQSHELFGMRGTAFFVLGLISRSTHGMEILLEQGWDSVTNATGESLGFCIPQDLRRFFSIQPWKHQTVLDISGTEHQTASIRAAKTDDDADNSRILELVVELGNTVLSKRSISELSKFKTKKSAGFHQVRLFKKVMTLLECHHYPLPVRRFIIDLFDKAVMRRIVLEEDSEEDEDEDEESEDGDSDND